MDILDEIRIKQNERNRKATTTSQKIASAADAYRQTNKIKDQREINALRQKGAALQAQAIGQEQQAQNQITKESEAISKQQKIRALSRDIYLDMLSQGQYDQNVLSGLGISEETAKGIVSKINAAKENSDTGTVIIGKGQGDPPTTVGQLQTLGYDVSEDTIRAIQGGRVSIDRVTDSIAKQVQQDVSTVKENLLSVVNSQKSDLKKAEEYSEMRKSMKGALKEINSLAQTEKKAKTGADRRAMNDDMSGIGQRGLASQKQREKHIEKIQKDTGFNKQTAAMKYDLEVVTNKYGQNKVFEVVQKYLGNGQDLYTYTTNLVSDLHEELQKGRVTKLGQIQIAVLEMMKNSDQVSDEWKKIIDSALQVDISNKIKEYQQYCEGLTDEALKETIIAPTTELIDIDYARSIAVQESEKRDEKARKDAVGVIGEYIEDGDAAAYSRAVRLIKNEINAIDNYKKAEMDDLMQSLAATSDRHKQIELGQQINQLNAEISSYQQNNADKRKKLQEDLSKLQKVDSSILEYCVEAEADREKFEEAGVKNIGKLTSFWQVNYNDKDPSMMGDPDNITMYTPHVPTPLGMTSKADYWNRDAKIAGFGFSYNDLNQEEQSVVNYLLGKYPDNVSQDFGESTGVFAYLNSIQDRVMLRLTQPEISESKIGAIIKRYNAGIEDSIKDLMYNISRLKSGEYSGTRVAKSQYKWQNEKEKHNIGWLGELVGDVAYSAGQQTPRQVVSAMYGPAGKIVSDIIFGTEVGLSSWNEKKAAGYSDGEALVYTVGNTVMQTALEHFLDSFTILGQKGTISAALTKLIDEKVDYSLLRLTFKGLLNMGSEGLEEIAQGISEHAIDYCIKNGEPSSELDWGQVFYGGLIGAVLGGVGAVTETVGDAPTEIENARTKKYANQTDALLQSLIFNSSDPDRVTGEFQLIRSMAQQGYSLQQVQAFVRQNELTELTRKDIGRVYANGKGSFVAALPTTAQEAYKKSAGLDIDKQNAWIALYNAGKEEQGTYSDFLRGKRGNGTAYAKDIRTLGMEDSKAAFEYGVKESDGIMQSVISQVHEKLNTTGDNKKPVYAKDAKSQMEAVYDVGKVGGSVESVYDGEINDVVQNIYEEGRKEGGEYGSSTIRLQKGKGQYINTAKSNSEMDAFLAGFARKTGIDVERVSGIAVKYKDGKLSENGASGKFVADLLKIEISKKAQGERRTFGHELGEPMFAFLGKEFDAVGNVLIDHYLSQHTISELDQRILQAQLKYGKIRATSYADARKEVICDLLGELIDNDANFRALENWVNGSDMTAKEKTGFIEGLKKLIRKIADYLRSIFNGDWIGTGQTSQQATHKVSKEMQTVLDALDKLVDRLSSLQNGTTVEIRGSEGGVRNSVADFPIDPQIEKIVDDAVGNPSVNKKHDIGTISQKTNSQINRLANQKLFQYSGKYTGGKHLVMRSAILHSLAEHGDVLREALRASLPITKVDVARMLSAVKNDKATVLPRASWTNRGNPSVLQFAEVNGYTLYAEEIKKSNGKDPSDLIGRTMYKEPTLATAGMPASIAGSFPKRQRLTLEYSISQGNQKSRINFLANNSQKPQKVYVSVKKDGSFYQNRKSGNLIFLSADKNVIAKDSNRKGEIEERYVIMNKPFYITSKNRVFKNSKENVSAKIAALKKQGYDGFIFDYKPGDNYAVMVFSENQLVEDLSNYKPMENLTDKRYSINVETSVKGDGAIKEDFSLNATVDKAVVEQARAGYQSGKEGGEYGNSTIKLQKGKGQYINTAKSNSEMDAFLKGFARKTGIDVERVSGIAVKYKDGKLSENGASGKFVADLLKIEISEKAQGERRTFGHELGEPMFAFLGKEFDAVGNVLIDHYLSQHTISELDQRILQAQLKYGKIRATSYADARKEVICDLLGELIDNDANFRALENWVNGSDMTAKEKTGFIEGLKKLIRRIADYLRSIFNGDWIGTGQTSRQATHKVSKEMQTVLDALDKLVDRLSSLQNGATVEIRGREGKARHSLPFRSMKRNDVNRVGWADELFSSEDKMLLNDRFVDIMIHKNLGDAVKLKGNSYLLDINNKMVIIGGSFDNPIIHYVMAINANNATYAQQIKEAIFENEYFRTATATETRKYFKIYEDAFGSQVVVGYHWKDFGYNSPTGIPFARLSKDFASYGYTQKQQNGSRVFTEDADDGEVNFSLNATEEKTVVEQARAGYQSGKEGGEYGSSTIKLQKGKGQYTNAAKSNSEIDGFLRRFARKTGIDVERVSGIAVKYKDGKLSENGASGKFVADLLKIVISEKAQGQRRTFGHELGESMFAFLGKEFDAVGNVLIDHYLSQHTISELDQRILQAQLKYGKIRATSYADARKEVICDLLGELIDNDANFRALENWVNGSDMTAKEKTDFIEGLKKLIQKIADYLRSIFNGDWIGTGQTSQQATHKVSKEMQTVLDALDKLVDRLSSLQNGTTVEIRGSEGGVRNQFMGYAEDGKGKYKSAYPKGTPKAAKSKNILKLIQDVWSKKPLRLKLKENGKDRYIYAQFDPTYDERGEKISDATKLMGGNRHGTASEQRVTLDISDDYYQIAMESKYNYSKDETGKNLVTHEDVVRWHYFINDIYFPEYASDEYQPYHVTINVKEKTDGNFVYSFSAEKEKEPNTPQTLHAAVRGHKTPNVQLSNTKIAQNAPGVNNYSMQKTENDTNMGEFSLNEDVAVDQASNGYRGRKEGGEYGSSTIRLQKGKGQYTNAAKSNSEIDGFLRRFARKTGIDVERVSGIAVKYKDGKLSENGASGKFVADLLKIVISEKAQGERRAFGHELGESIFAFLGKEFDVIGNVLIDYYLSQHTISELDQRILQAQLKYGKVRATSYPDARKEVICDLLGELIDNDANFRALENWVNGSDMTAKEKTGFIEGLKKLIRKIADYLRSIFNGDWIGTGQTSRQATYKVSKEMQTVLDALDKLVDRLSSLQNGTTVEIRGSEGGTSLQLHDVIIDQFLVDKNIKEIAQMDPVFSMTGTEFAKGEEDLVTQVDNYFKEFDESVYSAVLGDVDINKKGAKSSLGHGMGRNKAIAYAAVPAVIEYGKIIDYQTNWKNRGYDTVAMAAPVTIGDATYYEGVIVIREKGSQHFYLHEVVTEKRTATPFKTGTNQMIGTPSGATSPSLISLLKKIQKVKENMDVGIIDQSEIVEQGKINVDTFAKDDGTIKEDFSLNATVEEQEVEQARAQSRKRRDQALGKYTAQMDRMARDEGRLPMGEMPSRNIAVPARVNGQKTMRWARTFFESGVGEPEMLEPVAKEVLEEGLGYTAISNKQAIHTAEVWLENRGYDRGIEEFAAAVDAGILNKDLVARGQTLLRIAADRKDHHNFKRLVVLLSEVETVAGQTVQAASMLKRMGSEVKLFAVKRMVDKLNQRLAAGKFGKKGVDMIISMDENAGGYNVITIDPDLIHRLLEAGDDGEAASAAVVEIYKDIARQLPYSFNTAWNAWRYLAMLLNPVTHIRNFIGNGLFVPVVSIKNTIKWAMEQLFARGEHTTKLLPASKAAKEFAKKDVLAMETILKAGGKYNEQDVIDQCRKKLPWLFDKLEKFNSGLLEKEDWLFLRYHYTSALARYLDANHIDPDSITDAQLQKARDHATREALKATYRDASVLASKFNDLADTNPGTKIMMDVFLPFKKTPINILKRGMEYSPVGLIHTLSRGIYQLKKGNISFNEWLDGIAAGLTGSMIVALGMFLGSLGWLQGGFGQDDDDPEDKAKDKLKQLTGVQEYSLIIGDTSYTIDWAAPAAIPLFIGVELMEALKDEDTNLWDRVMDAVIDGTDVIVNMSMLDGLQGFIDGIKYENSALLGIFVNTPINYFSQALPTIFGKVANTADAYSRSNYVDSDGETPTFLQQAFNKIKAKIPGLSATRNEYIDEFGRSRKVDSWGLRFVQNFLSPGYFRQIQHGELEDMMNEIYENAEQPAAIPSRASKSFVVGGQRVYLNAEQYETFARERGSIAYDIMVKMIKSSNFDDLNYDDMQDALKTAYEYSNAVAKTKVSEYELEGWQKEAAKLEGKGVAISDYILYRGLTKEPEDREDAVNILQDAGLSYRDARRFLTSIATQYKRKYEEDGIDTDTTVDAALKIEKGDYSSYQSAVKSIITSGYSEKDAVEAIHAEAGIGGDYIENTIYTSGDLYNTLMTGDSSYSTIYSSIQSAKVKNGATVSKAKSGIKSGLTRSFKTNYQKGDSAKRKKIVDAMKRSGLWSSSKINSMVYEWYQETKE